MPDQNQEDPNEEQKNLMKEAFKEAIQEWLDKQYAVFGRWSFWAFMSLAVVALLYFILNLNGWHQIGEAVNQVPK